MRLSLPAPNPTPTSMHEPPNTALLIATFAVFWFGGAAIMSRIAGWHALSGLYPAPVRFLGQELRFRTVTLGTEGWPLTYRRCVRVALNDDGIGLCLMFPFRFYSPPFFAPWKAVVACTEKQSFITSKVTLTFAGTNRQTTFAGPLGQVVKSIYEARMRGE